MARQRQAYHRQGQRRKPRSALPRAQRADTLAACATRVMWTPDRRLAGRSALRAVHGCRGRGQEIPAGQPEPGIRPASTPTAAIRMAAASRAAGTTARSTRAPSRPAALPQARPCTDQRAAARARARPGVSPPHLARLPPFTRPASSPPGTGSRQARAGGPGGGAVKAAADAWPVAASAEHGYAEPDYAILAVSDPAADATATQTLAVADHPAAGGGQARTGRATRPSARPRAPRQATRPDGPLADHRGAPEGASRRARNGAACCSRPAWPWSWWRHPARISS